VGHLKLKNLSANFCICSTNYNFWSLGACNIPLERSWKYFQELSNGILQAPKCSKITVEKNKNKNSPLVTVDQGGQKNHNGKSSITNYQRVEL
jgi:hypothetical protein